VFDDLPRGAGAWQALIQSEQNLSALAGEWKFPDRLQRVRRPWGHARRYGAAGAVLMGDAAHPVSPAGGQGANMSVADARVLAELLSKNSPGLLGEYERRRRPANTRSIRPTRILSLLFNLPRWFRPQPSLLKKLGSFANHNTLKSRGLRFVSTAFLENPQTRSGT